MGDVIGSLFQAVTEFLEDSLLIFDVKRSNRKMGIRAAIVESTTITVVL
jgi:hypothetical protein